MTKEDFLNKFQVFVGEMQIVVREHPMANVQVIQHNEYTFTVRFNSMIEGVRDFLVWWCKDIEKANWGET